VPETIAEWQKEISEWGKRKGWTFETINIPEKLCLMHSEISEALEEYRHGHLGLYYSETPEGPKPEGMAVELADAVIRILHFCAHRGINLQHMIEVKMAYNEKRPYRHGGLNA
jgi:NTP pyrophosphatase (non-canonical NTP hydrolase)